MADLKVIHNFFREYLEKKGINTKTAFRCVSPTHEDKHPSMLYSDKAKKCICLACGEKYDIFKFVGMEYNLPTFKEQLKKIEEIMQNPELIKNANETVYSKKNTEIKLSEYDKNNFIDKELEKKYNFFRYYKKCKENIHMTNYLETRGISKEVQLKYNVGYDPAFKRGEWKAVIFPISYDSFTARRVDSDSSDNIRKVGTLESFNYWELEKEKTKPFFIVEGEIDALSFCEINQKSISLGSIYNTYHFIEKLKKDMPKNRFILVLDNDDNGRKVQEKLYNTMLKLGLRVESADNFLESYKDPNEFLVKDRKKFIAKTMHLLENEKINPFKAKLKNEKKNELTL